jgi:hypothetical protein
LIWRSVITVRAVREALRDIRPRPEGRGAAIAQHGELLIAHIVLQHLPANEMDDPGFEWDGKVHPRVAEVTEHVLHWLIHHIDAQYGTSAQIISTVTNAERCKALTKAVLTDLHIGSTVPTMPAEYMPPARTQRVRRPNAVPTLVDAKALDEGTRLVFQPEGANERRALEPWLSADPRRAEATWVNDRTKPLLWTADQNQYSPSGLVSLMWKLANWEGRPVSNQGPSRWHVAGGESLWDMALRIQSVEEAAETE